MGTYNGHLTYSAMHPVLPIFRHATETPVAGIASDLKPAFLVTQLDRCVRRLDLILFHGGLFQP